MGFRCPHIIDNFLSVYFGRRFQCVCLVQDSQCVYFGGGFQWGTSLGYMDGAGSLSAVLCFFLNMSFLNPIPDSEYTALDTGSGNSGAYDSLKDYGKPELKCILIGFILNIIHC